MHSYFSTTRNDSASSTPVTLFSSTVAPVPVQTQMGASGITTKAADDLSTYLGKMAGETFPRTQLSGVPANPSGIIVGTLQEFPDASLDTALAIHNGIDGREAYAIRAQGNLLKIIGATDKAASHGVYRLLEELGCRWFFQSDNWEVIPTMSSITFGRNITDRPTFLARDIWYAWWFFNDAGHPQGNGRSANSDYTDWARRNRMAMSFTVNCGHSYEAIARDPVVAAELAAHPEYWALVNGVRQGPQFEWGNPGLRQVVIDWAIRYFQNNLIADMVSVDPADGGDTSESPEALAYATANDAPFKLANEVAVAVRNAFPGQNKMVGLYAYNWHSDPPAFALEPNVYVQLTAAFNGGAYTYDQLMQLWPQKVTNLGFYDYYSTWRWDFDRWPGGRAGNKNYITGQIAAFNAANSISGAYATSISAESGNNWGLHGRTYYLANKLMWNPSQNSEDILDDFYAKAFGAGADAMKAYYAVQDNPPPPTKGMYKVLYECVHDASQSTLNDAAVQKRIDDIKIYLNFEYMNYRHGKAATTAEQTMWRDRIWKWVYRTRYTYMNHWEAIRQDWIHDDGDLNAAWRDETPMTHAEIETLFQEARNYYPAADPIPPRRTFSKNLKRVELGGANVGYASPLYQDQGGGTRIFMYSDGSPLQIRSACVLMYWGSQRSWTLKNAAGNVVVTGVPPSDRNGTEPPAETWTTLSIPVPAAGVYEFIYNDLRDLWRFEVDPSQTIAFPISANMGTTTLYGSSPELYFYVPKGATEFNFYFGFTPWSSAGPSAVVDPNGVVRKTIVDGDANSYIKVMVPADTDGKAWKFSGPRFGLGGFDFFDVPNVLSPSQARMLVPEDLVASDNLTLVPDATGGGQTATGSLGQNAAYNPADQQWEWAWYVQEGGVTHQLPISEPDACGAANPCVVPNRTYMAELHLKSLSGTTNLSITASGSPASGVTTTNYGPQTLGIYGVRAVVQFSPQYPSNQSMLDRVGEQFQIAVTADGGTKTYYFKYASS